jgi:PEP-CTERM motif
MNSALQNTLRRSRTAAFTALAMATLAAAAHADNLVVNGGFETVSQPGVSAQFGTGQSQQVSGWTTSGYNFVFASGAADTTGASGNNGNVQLWGPGNGSANGLPASSPNGGNFLALDGNFEVGAVSQMINGLTVGDPTTVSFLFAGAQQASFTGPTTEQIEVSLGSQNQFTSVLDNTSEGFTGWQSESFTFTPTSSSELLSFLAIGTPSGVPPMSLLDGVSVSGASPVPEPGSLALLSTGLIGLGGFVRSRFKRSSL